MKRNAFKTTWSSALLGKFLANILLASLSFWSCPCEKQFGHKSAPVIPGVCPCDFQIEALVINHCLFPRPVAS